ncbi:MAG: hypothetical protein IPJ60_11925 [Sphingobacteriaceae bacterium]|nr:hypothetical protein [Sphingobacteriaceae bacterium]
MKKVLLALAFTGLLAGSAFAGEGTKGDDKDKKSKKECCKKDGDAKACAGEKKETCAKGEKSCCKKKAEGTTSTAAADTKTAEQPKK